MIRIFSDRQELAMHLASNIVGLSREAVEDRGRFFIAVSGGSLVDLLQRGLPVFNRAEENERQSWRLFWVDERLVPWESPDSNFGTAKRMLLDHLSLSDNRVYPVPQGLKPEETAERYASDIRNAFGVGPTDIPRFDLILLGLGEDGHSASLFPGRPGLREESRLVVPVLNAPKPPSLRVTMTLPLIRCARYVVFAVIGAEKAEILAEVLEAPDGASRFPARMISSVGADVQWLIDRDAARRLTLLPTADCCMPTAD